MEELQEILKAGNIDKFEYDRWETDATLSFPDEGGVNLMSAYIDNNEEHVSNRALELMFDLGVDPSWVNRDSENVACVACMRAVDLDGFKLMKARGVEVGYGSGAACWTTYAYKNEDPKDEVYKFFIECGTTPEMLNDVKHIAKFKSFQE